MLALTVGLLLLVAALAPPAFVPPLLADLALIDAGACFGVALVQLLDR